MLIDAYLPTYDVVDHHETLVRAPATTAYSVLRAIDLRGSWVVSTLFALRAWPSRLLGRRPPPLPAGSLLEQVLALGWVILEELPGEELVAGAVTQPWAASVRFRGLAPAEFEAFSTPGFTKIAFSLAARATGPMETLLTMETRVLATDPASRRKFRAYWFVVSPGVRLIRVVALRTARRRLERGLDARHRAHRSRRA